MKHVQKELNVDQKEQVSSTGKSGERIRQDKNTEHLEDPGKGLDRKRVQHKPAKDQEEDWLV